MNKDYSNFPRQKKSYKEKDDAWRRDCVDSSINLCNTYGHTRRSPMAAKRRNYDLLNNKINLADFQHILNPFRMVGEDLKDFQFPASIQPYDIVSEFFMLLFGEESKRLFTPVVRAINEEALHSKQQIKKQEILSSLEEILSLGLAPDPENPDPFKLLGKYSTYTPKEMRESVSEKLLTYYRKYNKLDDLWQEGWLDALVAGEEIYSVDIYGAGPKVRRVNPMEIHFKLPNNTSNIDEAELIYEKNRMSISEIIDEFYEFLTPAQITELEDYSLGVGSAYSNFYSVYNIPEVNSMTDFSQDYTDSGFDVHRVRWKSKKKVGSWHYIDENGQEQEETVHEDFKIDKSDKSQWIEWFWINEYWEGTRIGADMYLNIRPRKEQFRSMDNVSLCKSGYIGTVYNAQNAQSVSLMDRLVPWVYLYLVIWYRTELALAKNLGKIALIDVSLIPDKWEPEKWIYYAQAMGFGFVDSYNEGEKAARFGQVNQSTQTKQLDLETGNYIQGHVSLLDYIKEQMKHTAGITDQRLGAIQASELVGNTERSVTQSSHITEMWFKVHNNVKIRTCEALIEVAKSALEGKDKRFQYVTDDLATILFTVCGDEFCDADYGVFTSDSGKDTQAIDHLKQLMEVSLQQDKIRLSQIIDVFNSESLSDVKNKLVQAENENMEQAQAAQQEQLAAEQQMHAEQMQMKQAELDLKKYDIDTKAETAIHTATISALGFDTTDGGEIISTAENALKEREIASKELLETQKILHDRLSKEKELGLKAREIQSKENIEHLKIKQTDVQNKSQEKIAKQQALMKEKELKMKEKIERLKIKAKPKPKK